MTRARSITLGTPALRDGRYVIPVIVTVDEGLELPQALSLRVRLLSGVRGATIRRAGAAKEVATLFETSPASADALSYLVSFDQSKGGLTFSGETVRSAVVAEIELTADAEGFALDLDPAVTMLSNAAGSRWATVARGTLRLSAPVAGMRALPPNQRMDPGSRSACLKGMP